ncbi:hypothetical protein SAMN05421690_103516 [Nitrosomonas sp. Nm51]|uniref:hypothetical protein n=1 Tax=Nitrosomonas sp. Nm51 TaxID=133720 RepID=UPI0008C9D51E|nr:hypothetical protein [Nitrosomonas sp. Nm51]SER53192.1 hypothetical protein SAMN05421690_103516 [Nitrosomonas sp. Nm51]
MKNLFVSLMLYGLALVLYNHLLNENYDGINSIHPAANWNYKEKLAAYVDRERPLRQPALPEDQERSVNR